MLYTSSMVSIVAAIHLLTLVTSQPTGENSTFVIDPSTKCFVLNGHPFRYVSGSVHYFRIHPGVASNANNVTIFLFSV